MKKQYKLKLFILSAISLLVYSVKAQPFCYWSKGAGQAKTEEARGIAVDVNGNVYTTGFFESPTITFGGTTLINSDNTGTSTDIFVVKQDSCGNVIWARSYGETYYDDKGISIKVDNSGAVYLAGNYISYTLTLGSTTLINNLGVADYFLAKLNSSGNVIWAKGIDNNESVYPESIAIDGKNCVYMTGSFTSDSLKFENDTLINSGEAGYYSDAFLAKFNPNGNLIWAKSAGDSLVDDQSYSVTTDGNYNVYFSGTYSDSISFGATKYYANPDSAGTDIFITKCDSAGNLLWLKGYGGNYTDVARGLDVDSQDNLYLTGWFSSDSIIFDTHKITNTAWYSAGFLVKLTPAGTASWAKTVAGKTEDYLNDVAIDKNDNPVVMGHFFSDYVQFGSQTYLNTTSVDTLSDIFLAKYSSNGNFIWAKTAGGLKNDFSEGIAIGPNNLVYLTGEYKSPSIDFGDKTITNAGAYDIFVTNQVTQNNVPVPDICMVMVDSASQYNHILWDKTSHTTGVKNYIVYREIATNNFQPIGVIPYDSLSMFIDTVRVKYFPNTGNPNVGSYRYKLQIEDSAGNFSVLSPYHNTLYIVDNGSGTFSWNPLYTIEGSSNPVNSYELVRDDDGTGNWQVRGSVSGTQNVISDPLYSTFPNGKWRIQTQWSISCSPTQKMLQTSITKSRSNVKDNFVISGIQSPITNNLITVFPNPATDNLLIEWPEQMIEGLQNIIVRNYLGMEVFNLLPNKNQSKLNLDISNLPSGIYSIEAKGDKFNVIKKVVVN